jgi:hypothetical protein
VLQLAGIRDFSRRDHAYEAVGATSFFAALRFRNRLFERVKDMIVLPCIESSRGEIWLEAYLGIGGRFGCISGILNSR